MYQKAYRMSTYLIAIYKYLCGSRASPPTPTPQPEPPQPPPPPPDTASFMVPWSNIPSDNPPARYRQIMKHTDQTPRGVAEFLSITNKKSDEYYTPFATWARFLSTEKHTAYWEPFYGDGSGVQGLRDAGYTIHGQPIDFWDIDWSNAPDVPILSNPPFSFKWLIIEELLKHRREFHLILPWQTFIEQNGGAVKLRRMMAVYGGSYTGFKLRHSENKYVQPDGTVKPIGCLILSWRFAPA